jgi:NB-ARC domain/Helix-turn-helix
MSEENSFGYILKSFLARKGTRRGTQWTQEQVGARLDPPVSRVTINRWLNNVCDPTPEHIEQLVKLLELNKEDEIELYSAAKLKQPIQEPSKIDNLPYQPNSHIPGSKEHADSLHCAVAQPPPEIFDVPFLLSSYFTGRATYLEQLRQFLQKNGIVCLTGLAGIGKTQIALKYADSYHPDVYRTVLWVNAADRSMLETEYASLAQTLGLPEKDDQDLYRRLKAVKNWLRTHTNWLLIMDNADELPIVRPFLLPKPLGHIVLTTRWQFTDKIAKLLAVEAMGPEEGLLFLWRRTRTEQDKAKGDTIPQDIRELGLQLVEELGGHALALEQAGAYIQETPVSFSDYLILYQENRLSLLSQYGALDDEHKTVAATFKASIARARELAP